jgi:hypothetical protein
MKSVGRGSFLVAVYGVFILRTDVLLHYVETYIFSYGLLDVC